MEQEDKDKDLEDLFEKARHEEPVISLGQAQAIISAPKVSTSAGKTKLRTNIIRGTILLVFLFLLKFGYDFFNLRNDEISGNPSKDSNKENIKVNQEPDQTSLSGDHRSKIESKPVEKFPPEYKEENISRPVTDQKIDPGGEKRIPEKTLTKTDGHATISFIEGDKKVKLTLYFSEVTELVINGNKIGSSDYSEYTDIIKRGQQMEKNGRLENENSEGISQAEREQRRQNEIVMNTIIKSLARDGLISAENHFDFRLVWYKVFIDGKEQSNEVYEKYKTLYEEASGKNLTKESNVHIKH